MILLALAAWLFLLVMAAALMRAADLPDVSTNYEGGEWQ
jgi:hypothetical protein